MCKTLGELAVVWWASFAVLCSAVRWLLMPRLPTPGTHPCSCAKYYEQGARFAKWRAVLKIGNGCPSGAYVRIELVGGRRLARQPGGRSRCCSGAAQSHSSAHCPQRLPTADTVDVGRQAPETPLQCA